MNHKPEELAALDAQIAAAEAELEALIASTSSPAPQPQAVASSTTTNPTPAPIENHSNPKTIVAETSEPEPVETKPTATRHFNRAKFFAAYKTYFGGLTQAQVDGLEALLEALEHDTETLYPSYMAYMLATIKHETANSFRPITEYGGRSYFNRYDPVLADTATRRRAARAHGNTQKGDGYTYRGRGFVQITWKNNYKRLGDAIGCDLVNYPEKALDPEIAYQIMSYGMRNGVFTGKKLSDYMSANSADYKNARRIINALDKADTIKNYAIRFEKIFNNAIE